LSTASPLLPLSTAVIDMLRMPEIARPCVVVAKKVVRSCWRGGAESQLENTTNFLFCRRVQKSTCAGPDEKKRRRQCTVIWKSKSGAVAGKSKDGSIPFSFLKLCALPVPVATGLEGMVLKRRKAQHTTLRALVADVLMPSNGLSSQEHFSSMQDSLTF